MAGKVKECFMGEKGLAGQVRKAPLEDVFKLANVKAVGHARPMRMGMASMVA